MAKKDYARRRHEPGSVGIVKRQFVDFDAPLQLESGKTLERFTLAYETYGTLNTDRSNAILICHALSGDSHVAGYYTDDPDEAPGWWDDAVGPGKMFDTERFYVICANVIGGCQGSTGPSSLAPDGKPYGLRFPFITVKDMVLAQRHLMDYLGIEKIFAAAGGSMGGMQALQWAVDYPERLGTALFIASTPRSSPQAIAFNEIGRQAIYADPNWNGGDYYDKTPPNAGLAVARMVGHITYMCEESLERKFGRSPHTPIGKRYDFGTDFSVESYLHYQGEKFTKRFDANSYLYITKALDYFDISEGHASLADALRGVQCPFLVITISSDWLYPATQGYELVEALEALGKPVQYHHIEAFFGHDSFLVEVELMTQLVGGYLDRLWQSQSTVTAADDRTERETKMASIKIPTPLRPFTSNQAEVDVSGSTVGAALNDLVRQYPDLRQHLFNGNELRSFVNVFLGEEDIRFLDGLDTEIDGDTSLRIIPSIAGGTAHFIGSQ